MRFAPGRNYNRCGKVIVMKNTNRISDAIRENKTAIGVHVASADICFYEMAGSMGYDYIWIDTEHSAMTLPMVLSGVAAANAGGSSVIVRLAKNDPILAKPVLDMGVQGIVFPMVNTAAEAEMAVKSCIYPPLGNRGFGPLRASWYGEVPTREYMDTADKTILKMIQIEHVDAVKNLPEILKVEGIDVIICGPMDLSASIGKAGQMDDPEVVDLFETIAEACKTAKIPFGTSIGWNPKLFEYWLSKGVSCISMGDPVGYFREMGIKVLKDYRGK